MTQAAQQTPRRQIVRNDAPPYIVASALQKVFRQGDEPVYALNGVDLVIRRGEFVAIKGESGSGKSTLMYLLGGLDRPTAGSIEIAGERIDLMNGEELAAFRREQIGFIFQQYHLVPTMTALENVALPGVFAGIPRDEREARAAMLLRALKMEHRAAQQAQKLSGGQQQRVAIARALFNNPPIIMGDEPTGALDRETRDSVMRLLRRLCSERGKTLIIVTHSDVVATYADVVITLSDGQIEHIGEPDAPHDEED